MALSLHRNSNPTTITYLGDGRGRDSYIIFNNLGRNETRTIKYPQPRSLVTGTSSPIRISPMKDASAFDYISDGSGRDSYIIKNSAGLKREYTGG